MGKVADGKSICMRVAAALASSPIRELRDLEVRSDSGVLELVGSVASFYHRQAALETVRSVARGMPIENRINVRPMRSLRQNCLN